MPSNVVADPITEQTYWISGIEIFSTGTWHGDEYTDTHLDQMVSAFSEVGFTPPLKLGHSEKQKLAKDGGFPNVGAVTSIYRRGKKLFADFAKIPEKIYKIIKAGNYGPVSVEIYWNYDDPVKKIKWPRVLKAVALLGEEIPEVTTIDGFLNLYDESAGCDRCFKVVLYGQEPKTPCTCQSRKEKNMTEEEIKQLQDRLAALERDNKAKTDELERVSAFSKEIEASSKGEKERLVKLEAQLVEEKTQRRIETINAKVAEFVRAKKIAPAQAPYLLSIMNQLGEVKDVPVKFSKDGSDEIKKFASLDIVQKFIELQAPLFPSETTKEGIHVDSDDSALHQRVIEYCKSHNLDQVKDYSKAMRAVQAGREV